MMTNDELLQEYRRSIRRLRDESNQAGISDEEFKKIYLENLNDITKDNVVSRQKSFVKTLCFLLASCFVIFIIIYNFKSVYNYVVCNLQEFIYPGLRLLRKLTIPLISLFPSLTDFYQEPCLIQNPFFTVVDMDCWPCSTVHNVGEVYDPQPVHKQHNTPFIYKTEQPEVDVGELKKLYIENKNIFNQDNSKVLVDNQYYQPLTSIFEGRDNLFIWKINTINVARAVRKIIPRPKVVPKFGQSIERFIIIDSKHNAFEVPDTECHFSFVQATSGTRIVDLMPAEECKHECKSFKVELKESYLLWYNWWYWRPHFSHSSSNKTFIAHVGSYC